MRHVGLLSLLVCHLLPACAREAAKPAPAPLASASSTTFSVDPVPVVSKQLDVALTLPGELAPHEQVDIYARANGFVRTVAVDRGSTVKRGAVLIRLDAPELSSQRSEADAKVAGERTTVDRLRAAQKQTPGAVAEHDIELAEASLHASQARVTTLRSLESYLTVSAPFDGVVTERNIHPGALVGPPAGGRPVPLLRPESVAKLRLTVAVPEDQTSAIRLGDVLDFSARAWPQRKLHGTVVRIAHAVDTKTRTMPVELEVDNADGALASGMYVSVAWHARRPAPSLFVPEGAIAQGTERSIVVRIKDGRADPVVVQRGMAMAGLVEVFGDLRADEIVAKRGSEELKAGTPVSIRAAAK